MTIASEIRSLPEQMQSVLHDLTSAPELRPILASIAACTRTATESSAAVVVLHQGDKPKLVEAAGVDGHSEAAIRLVLDVLEDEESTLATVMRSGRPLLMPDIAGDPRLAALDRRAQSRVASMAVVPLVDSADVVGVLTVCYERANDLGPDVLDLITAFAHLIVQILTAERSQVTISGLEDADRRQMDLIGTVVHELQEAHVGTVEALAGAVELRDEYTGGHIARVRGYSLALARRVDPALASDAHASAYMLHDIGKLAIPDSVLLKPGGLTDEEFEIFKLHTTAGAHYVEAIPFLRHMTPLVRSHHERWDGGGYPDGRAGTEIPLVARIFAVADTLDAMTTDRPYRRAQPFEVACEEIRRCSGTQFDPSVVKAFMVVAEKDEVFADLRAGVVPGRDHLPGPLIRAFRAAGAHTEHRPA